jgi:hypothetical protein
LTEVILNGENMTASLPFLQDMILNMRDPDHVKAVAIDPSNINPAPLSRFSSSWADLSLSNGYPSLLLLFSTLGKQGLIEDGDAIAHQYVLKIKEVLEAQGCFGFSLFSGVTGICFALQQASFEGKRYQRMLQNLHTFLVESVEKEYLEPLRQKKRQSLPISPRLYDPIQGVCGIGRYALENLEDPSFLKVAEDIVKVVVSLSQPLLYKEQKVPGWFLSPNDLLNARNRTACPNGNFNLGLAHGVCGILAFLAIASLRGVDVEGQKEAIALIASWVRSKSVIYNTAVVWPYHVSWEEEVEGRPSPIMGSKDAWCYGVPGIARTLFLAGKALGDEAMKAFAIHAFHGIFSRQQKEWHLPGPTLCHGISGLLLITHEMSKEEGCEDLALKVQELSDLLMSFYRPEAPWGFKDVEACLQGKQCELNKPGLLEGTSGVILALSSLSNPAFNWHLPLLIHA